MFPLAASSDLESMRRSSPASVVSSAPQGNTLGAVSDADSTVELENFISRDVEDVVPTGDGEVRGDLTGEYANIALLLLLYMLQGVPMGLSGVLPLVLKERGATFSQLGTLSLNSYPFSLKLLWAPIVDAAYFARFGRRKTWMVPAQLLIGLMLVWISALLDELMYGETLHVEALTALFFILYFLCATQDIAVDGWALTMLRAENVGYAATCNTIGQTLGYTMGFTGFMALEQWGLVTLAGFMFVWGVTFIVVTLLVAFFKAEQPVPSTDELNGIGAAYQEMASLLRLRAVHLAIAVLFTWKVAFAATDAVAPLKFQEYGMTKESMAYLTSLVMPVYIVVPAIVAPWTSGRTPLDLALRVYPWRVALCPLTLIVAMMVPFSMNPIPWGFYTLVVLVCFAGAVTSQCMFVSTMAFFARVSDPAMGGTYMTMLNTLMNLGGMWPATTAMKLVDITTCSSDDCAVKTDGFFVLGGFCTVIGVLWLILGVPLANKLQHMKLSEWRVR